VRLFNKDKKKREKEKDNSKLIDKEKQQAIEKLEESLKDCC